MVPPKRRNQPRPSTGQASARPDNHPPERATPRHDPAFTTPRSPTTATPVSAAAAFICDLDPDLDFELDPDFVRDPEDFSLQLSAYLPSPGGPLITDSDTTIDFSRFGTFYEPQGELAPLALPDPSTSAPDFDQPIPISGATLAGPPIRGAAWTAIAAGPTAALISTPSRAAPTPAPIADPAPRSVAAAGAPGAPGATSRGSMTSRAGLKRKAGAASLAAPGAPDARSPTSAAKRPATGGIAAAAARAESSRSPATMRNHPSSTAAQSPAAAAPPEEQESSRAARARTAAAAARAGDVVARLNPVLPAGKLFPIRIGSELFQLSGASISSDGTAPHPILLYCGKLTRSAPSYFSHYFGDQLLQSGGRANTIKTLYIDRDPTTFQDVAKHLQGLGARIRDRRSADNYPQATMSSRGTAPITCASLRTLNFTAVGSC
jgi:hypothetical protein